MVVVIGLSHNMVINNFNSNFMYGWNSVIFQSCLYDSYTFETSMYLTSELRPCVSDFLFLNNYLIGLYFEYPYQIFVFNMNTA